MSQLYQQYQKASRLEGYLGDLEGVRNEDCHFDIQLSAVAELNITLMFQVMEDTQKLQSGVETLEHQYSVLGKAMKESLNIKLAHDKGR